MKSIFYLLASAAFSPLPSHGFHAPLSFNDRARTTELSVFKPSTSTDASHIRQIPSLLKSTVATATTFALASASAAWAVSGGGVDYASLDLTGQDFSNGNYKGKDFTQVNSLSL
jgi:hypothetical protein